MAGIVDRTIDNSAAYIANWLKALKNDKKLVVSAAGKAHSAADFILGVSA
jgi:antirestriction protein ArdC